MPEINNPVGKVKRRSLQHFPGVQWLGEVDDGDYLITTTQAEAYASAKVREAQQWQPIETAPHETDLLLGWKDWSGDWITEVSPASWGWKNERVSNFWKHGQATHWMPIPAPPLPSPVEPTT